MGTSCLNQQHGFAAQMWTWVTILPQRLLQPDKGIFSDTIWRILLTKQDTVQAR